MCCYNYCRTCCYNCRTWICYYCCTCRCYYCCTCWRSCCWQHRHNWICICCLGCFCCRWTLSRRQQKISCVYFQLSFFLQKKYKSYNTLCEIIHKKKKKKRTQPKQTVSSVVLVVFFLSWFPQILYLVSLSLLIQVNQY